MEIQLAGRERFFKILMPGFHLALNLPAALCKKLKLERSSVEAIVKSCKGRWKMQMCRNQELGLISFRDGWPDFVHAHELSIGDLLVFKHTGNFHFNAYVFDASGCEKGFNLGALKRDPKDTSKKKADEKGYAEGTLFKSKKPFFILTMKPYHAEKRSLVNIPGKFWSSNDIGKEKSVILRDPSRREWPVTLYCQKIGLSRCTFGKGWHEFYLGNELKMRDVCAFELIRNKPNNVVMDVHIFPALP